VRLLLRLVIFVMLDIVMYRAVVLSNSTISSCCCSLYGQTMERTLQLYYILLTCKLAALQAKVTQQQLQLLLTLTRSQPLHPHSLLPVISPTP